jgi:heme-degrading monooxygenase HmoA
MAFVEKIRSLSVNPDEILVSFDVVSLFTCIPSPLAIEVVKERLCSDPLLTERTNLSIDNIIKLLAFVLDHSFFVFHSNHYQQIFGCPMGSPVSAILANLVMEYVEDKALSSALYPPKWWHRYVDDSRACIKKEHEDEFHSHLNSINPHIKFTIEVETEGSIAFLDTKTTRKKDGSIAVSVFRKATHTDRYLDFKSHHHAQHKCSVVRTLMDRASHIPSTEEEVSLETKHVRQALSANNYPTHFITRNGHQSNTDQ